MMNKVEFSKTVCKKTGRLFRAAALVCGVAGLVSAQNGRRSQPPNFIVIIGDDIGYGDIGCNGHPHIRTPNIDRLARDGIRFEAAFLTASSCSPSRNSIISGRYPHNTGAQHLHTPLPEDVVTIPQLLQGAGYYTAAAGKWHLGPGVRKHFDRIEFTKPSGAETWVSVLKERPRDKPFFMWFASLDAHRGWSAQKLPNPHAPADCVFPPYLLDRPQYRKDMMQYYNEIGRLDDYVGKVREEVARQGISTNTFILFMADNGRPFPRCKNTCFDSGLQTPFIVRFPSLTDPRKGCSTKSLVSAVDIAPTLLDLAGVAAPDSFQGRSFRPILLNPDSEIRDQVFGEKNWHDFQGHERSVRTEDYLYIRNSFPELPLTPAGDCWGEGMYPKLLSLQEKGELPEGCGWVEPGQPAELLFDVHRDPHELRNLSENPEYAEILRHMRQRLDRWVDKTGDTVPAHPVPDFRDRKTNRALYSGSPAEFVNQHFHGGSDE